MQEIMKTEVMEFCPIDQRKKLQVSQIWLRLHHIHGRTLPQSACSVLYSIVSHPEHQEFGRETRQSRILKMPTMESVI